jgi:phospholipid/cholesterol/gamma-HCH transport system ATP-binding protein
MPDSTKPSTAKEDAFFVVEDVHKKFGDQDVLRGATLTIRRGETTAIIGASGGGKSVFLKHLVGLLSPDRGKVTVDGDDISHLTERALGPVRRKIGVLFQHGALFDSMTVSQNVAFPLREEGVRDEKEIEERVFEALRVVEMERHLAKMPIDLSGGMRKRVALARAVVHRPQSILYDEPTTGLDPVGSDAINHLIRRLQKQFAVTAVAVTHDMRSAYHIADTIAYLVEGRIYFIGTPDELRAQTDPVITDFIEGRSHAEDRPISAAGS